MPTLEFKGKQHIYAHHLTVPYRPLEPDEGRSVNPAGADDNLIVHGDNLQALKALLPRYAGRVKCIYIDPPYNTGNEGWVYNDRVNSPLMQAWLEANGPVDGEDLERHDKWLCMMWPRLHLLRELLAEEGIIFISIDDNEQHNLRTIMEEIFGFGNFIACLPTIMNLKGNNDEFGFSGTHEYTLCWAKNKEHCKIGEFTIDDEALEEWREDEYGYYKKGAGLKATGADAERERRSNLFFPVFIYDSEEVTVTKDDAPPFAGCEIVFPITDGRDMRWRWGKEKFANSSHDVLVERTSAGITLYKKQRPSIGNVPTRRPKSLFYKPEYSSGNGTAIMKKLFGIKVFDNPKPLQLLKDIITLSSDAESIILDSFAGSGTTAHAVIARNQEDNGNRKFILIECEDYADNITAERVRRVIRGVPTAKDTVLRDGLGGSFTYCTLGEPLDAEAMLTGEALPDWSALAAWLLHTASGISAGPADLAPQNEDGLFHAGETTDYYLLYEPDMEWLRSNEAILNEGRAKRIEAANRERGRKAIVFGPGKYIGQRDLTRMGISFCQLPYELHRTGQG